MKRFFVLISAMLIAVLAVPLVSARYYDFQMMGESSSVHLPSRNGQMNTSLAAYLRGLRRKDFMQPYVSARTIRQDPLLWQNMRKLWAEHVLWTHQYIVAAIAETPDASAAAERLLRNQEDIGNAIVPYYGNEAGAKLTSLLKDHILIAVDLVGAAKAGDTAKFTDADKRWHDNAAQIATFLSDANPAWGRQMVLDMLNEHLSLTTQSVTARLQQRWTDEASLFDRIFDQAMTMADTFSDGIIRQFPG